MSNWKHIIEATTNHRGFRKDPRLYMLHRHFKEYPIKSGGLGSSDIKIIHEVGWRIMGLSVSDADLMDPDKVAYLQGIALYYVDAIDFVISLLRRSFLYDAISRTRVGGNLISNSVMGRDFDSEFYGDVHIRILYKNYFHTRLVLMIDPYSEEKFIPLYQDGIGIFKKGYKKHINNVYVDRRSNNIYYITKIFKGQHDVDIEVGDDGRVQVNIRESKT
ncbi:MAG: hypothetical protein QXQ78_03240 [Candidatus Anstonellales archaeon]